VLAKMIGHASIYPDETALRVSERLLSEVARLSSAGSAWSGMTVQQQPCSKSPAAIRMRRMHERARAGVIVIPACEIPPSIVTALCDLGWLAPNETGNADAVADALWDLTAAALNAEIDRSPQGSTLIACSLAPDGVSALLSARWLARKDQGQPWHVMRALIDAANAAIGRGLRGNKWALMKTDGCYASCPPVSACNGCNSKIEV
jgi:hypothetical protein